MMSLKQEEGKVIGGSILISRDQADFVDMSGERNFNSKAGAPSRLYTPWPESIPASCIMKRLRAAPRDQRPTFLFVIVPR